MIKGKQQKNVSNSGAYISEVQRHPFLHEMKKNYTLYLMCVPALIFMIMFNFIPMPGLWMAFTQYDLLDGIFGSKFVGLKNFEYFFFGTGMGPKTIWNTLYINFWGLILGLVVPITIAILFNEIQSKRFKQFTQSMMFFPYFVSWVVVGALIYGLFATDVGIVNKVLVSLGKDPVRWYAEPQHWKPILIIANVWKWSGYNSIVYMAAMSGFDASLYEAAKVDGASKIQQIWYLTIPMLKSTAVILTLMSVGRIFFGDFGMVYGIIGNNSVIANEVAVIDTYVYNSMRSLGYSYSTAIGLFQSVMGLVLVTLCNKLAKKINEGEGLF